MKSNHIKYTIEFDVPVKIEDSNMNPNAYDYITAMLEQAVKTQIFYFKKDEIPPYTMRAKNIKITHETNVQEYHI